MSALRWREGVECCNYVHYVPEALVFAGEHGTKIALMLLYDR